MKMLTTNVIAAVVSTVIMTVPGYVVRKREEKRKAQEANEKSIEDLYLNFNFVDKDVFKELKSRQREA